MNRNAVAYSALVLALLLLACAPGSLPRGESQPAGDQRTLGAPKTLTIAFDGEPGNLVSQMQGGGVSPSEIRDAVHQHLATYNDRGEALPELAIELPSTAKGSWVVRPDGTMQTIYGLRSGVTWHDGTPLTARDFVFALLIHKDNSLPIGSPLVARHIDAIDVPDDLTLVIEWAKTYPFANAIVEEDLAPLPVHLLEQLYQTEKERFPNLPYWKQEFVGVGPYRLVGWEPGSHLTLNAYEAFYGGRAKIDTIIFRIIPNNATIVANLLAGAIDGSGPDVIDFNEVMLVKEEWEKVGKSAIVLAVPAKWRILGVQFRPDVTVPAEVLDVRFRAALLYGLDRGAMADLLFRGQSPVSDTFIPPSDQKWPWVSDSVVRYPYDSRRAHELLSAVGWRRGADGVYVNAAGERPPVAVWVTADPQSEQELAIVGDNWKALGVSVDQHVIPQALQRNRELRAKFPAFDITSGPVGFSYTTQRVSSINCPTEQNRWTGNNRGCYQNPALDRIVDGLNVAIEPADQQRLYRELAQMYSTDLPVLPLYFKIDAGIFREGVVGPRLSSPETNLSWNIHKWDIHS